MKYVLALLLLLVSIPGSSIAQEKEKTEEEKPKSSKARGAPLEESKGRARLRLGGSEPASIPDRIATPAKPGRRMVITDQRGRNVELAEFHLGSAGIWEYEGLRLRKPEDVRPPKRPIRGSVARTRLPGMQKRLHERLFKKRTNPEGPEPKPIPLTSDTLVQWDLIRQVDISPNQADKTLRAKIITTDDRRIEGTLKGSSDYLIGSTRNGRDIVVRLRNVRHIAFTSDQAERPKKPVAGQTKPYTARLKLGDKSPKKL